MQWADLVLGAVLGAIVGIVADKVVYARYAESRTNRKATAYYRTVNESWRAVERTFGRLLLVQAGWGRYFPEGTAVLTLKGGFSLDPRVRALRAAHEQQWLDQNQSDDEQVGISSLSIVRTSDQRSDELEGRAHRVVISAHRYRWFDFLASHQLLVLGTEHEKALLGAIVGEPDLHRTIDGFPNPCSVGLSVLCEGGTVLALGRRSTMTGSGGTWQPGKVYNAVGENATAVDFSTAFDGSLQATPDQIARRGLYQEFGFRVEDIQTSQLRIHSLAWSAELMDHKFFGFVISPLSRAETEDRWRSAPDRAELRGVDLAFRSVVSVQDCRELLKEIRNNRTDWSPEAIFCTLRTLLSLGRVDPRDLARVFG